MNEPSVTLRSICRVESEPYLSLVIEIASDEKKEKRVLVIPDRVYLELKLKKGEIGTALFDRLEDEARACAAYRRGLSILAYGANSERRLAQKLTQKGFDPDSAKTAAAALKSEGCINEKRDAVREAEACLKKLWGPRRILSKLCEKGYCNEALTAARTMLEDIDFPDLCAELIKKKFRSLPTDPKEREKITATLVRYGYSLSDIREARRLLSK